MPADGRWRCAECGASTDQPDDHFLHEHYDGSFICRSCSFLASNQEELVAHFHEKHFAASRRESDMTELSLRPSSSSFTLNR
ncbi:unnamed protein product [Bursaphelenchus xylophilus]|uniref:(pine wood nematode) hypothetical protein n=1 Tax=Bursaphelenchus xylophilus TaxID=6326 RepID=A0A1I7S6M2_BURXY|nr:unnamed protein product [Bursaphelenchus xylophilus]CAG9120568.1 unnamed protein product [Bursaphelenchus xylophilus]